MIDKTTNALSIDPSALDRLKLQAKGDPSEALKGAAKQFEALFLNMLLQSMREATPGDDLFGGNETKMYNEMLDQQLAQKMSGKGFGLADMITRQLAQAAGQAIDAGNAKLIERDGKGGAAFPLAPPAAGAVPLPKADGKALPLPTQEPAPAAMPVPGRSEQPAAPAPAGKAAAGQSTPRQFVDAVWPHAVEAAARLGVPPHFVVGHAALESGWGRREIVAADGTPSHNLFGVKAGPGWNGAVAEATTTEYVNGVAQTRVERFRAYPSYAEAFHDYAQMLQGKRYAEAVTGAADVEGFALGLQRSGYATDPMYGAKLSRLLNSVALRQALGG